MTARQRRTWTVMPVRLEHWRRQDQSFTIHQVLIRSWTFKVLTMQLCIQKELHSLRNTATWRSLPKSGHPTHDFSTRHLFTTTTVCHTTMMTAMMDIVEECWITCQMTRRTTTMVDKSWLLLETTTRLVLWNRTRRRIIRQPDPTSLKCAMQRWERSWLRILTATANNALICIQSTMTLSIHTKWKTWIVWMTYWMRMEWLQRIGLIGWSRLC